ncbi:MAG TPA: DUF4013 domain-containing protein [Methanothermococcus okinawensis]|uniref:DUF4013 domain-containing protein n=1 Tax=Methanothermococcus okinawensis TaxID=155863 RepID=A0A832ZJU7_9EURY|nr:DUF4013 domain-containing protein [Methanothermococcus okinawensis]
MSFIEKYVVEPLRYAFSDGWKLLIGILLLVFNNIITIFLYLMFIETSPYISIVISLINFFVSIVILGYYIGVIKNTLKGLDILPDWSNLGEIVKDGILYIFALIILYTLAFLPAILILKVGSSLTIGGDVSFSSSYYSNLSTIFASIFLLLTVVLSYVVMAVTVLWVYTPLATVNFAKKGFSGFFEIRDILKKKISLDYIVILVLYSIIYWIIGLLLGIFGIIPIIGTAISLVYFYMFYFIFSIVFFRAVSKYYLKKERGE